MQFRQFGKLDFKVSALGFGAMRLPTKAAKIDEAEATRMIRFAIDRGVNYVDTAYPYHDGESEVVVGRALAGGYRQKVKVATKLPCWLVKSASDFDKYLDIQLGRLGLEYVDFYLLHSLNGESWASMRDLGAIKWAEKAVAAGRLRHLGFSFHGDATAFTQIVDSYDWAMCQIQYNFMDVENQAGTKGLLHAAERGIPVVVMEPLLGGKLVNPPPSAQAIWNESAKKRSSAAWALDWLWNQPGVTTVLSGVSTMEQTKENVALAEISRVGCLDARELALYDRVRAEYKRLVVIPCTACGYCMPCPHGVDIPGNFGNYNDSFIFDKPASARGQYGWWKYAFEVQKIFDKDVRAAACTQCGDCEDKCPQDIPIKAWMPVIHSVLGEGKPFVREVAGK